MSRHDIYRACDFIGLSSGVEYMDTMEQSIAESSFLVHVVEPRVCTTKAAKSSLWITPVKNRVEDKYEQY